MFLPEKTVRFLENFHKTSRGETLPEKRGQFSPQSLRGIRQRVAADADVAASIQCA